MEKKRGRPTRKAYAGTCLTQELLETVSAVYAEKQEIKATALALEFPPHKVKKLLITHGDIHYAETDQIIERRRQGMSLSEIAKRMGMSIKTVNTYLPYSKVVYKLDDISQNAERVKKYQHRKKATERLRTEMTDDALRDCVVAFEGYPFYTVTGLPFMYTVGIGRHGEATREIRIDRCQSSKSLVWSSVRLAFDKAIRIEGVIERPKAIGDIRGISYLYSMLWRFGVIQVPVAIEQKLKGKTSIGA